MRIVLRAIDGLSEWAGHLAAMLCLVMVLLGAFNALARKVDDWRFSGTREAVVEREEPAARLSSNAYLEAQWYAFSLVFLLGAAATLRQNKHVRVDVLYGRLGARPRAGIDLAGTVLLLLPFCAFALIVTWPSVRESWRVGEGSPDPEGLARYPIKTCVLAGFALLCLQGVAEAARCVSRLREGGRPRVRLLGGILLALVAIGITAVLLLRLEAAREWLGPAMFVCAFALIFSGYPVAFSLGGAALAFALLGSAFGHFDLPLVYAFPERVYGVMANYTLLAVPFFIFMGTMLERSRLAEDLLHTIGQLFGAWRGGLALAVVFVGALLAAATGVVGASVVAMGMISLPVMLRYGYSKSLAAGVISASGTLGQIIPPSVVLVVLADQLGVSVGDLFRGALLPGIMLAGFYAIYVVAVAIFRPSAAPALPVEERQLGLAQLLARIVLVLIPPLALIAIVLGSIFFGVATPTEAGALGAVGAMLLAAVSGRLQMRTLRETMGETTRLTAMVIMLLIGSTLFALVFRGLDGDLWIEDLMTSLPGGVWGLILVANLVIFLLGFFIDFFEIAFIILPLLVAPATALDIDLVWFGVMVGMNLQTSFLTPPFGFSLFYLRGVAPPELPTTAIYRGAIPFIVIQLIGLALLCVFPQLVTWATG